MKLNEFKRSRTPNYGFKITVCSCLVSNGLTSHRSAEMFTIQTLSVKYLFCILVLFSTERQRGKGDLINILLMEACKFYTPVSLSLWTWTYDSNQIRHFSVIVLSIKALVCVTSNLLEPGRNIAENVSYALKRQR